MGTAAVRWLTAHVFATHRAHRIAGNTRQDNVAMRRTFAKAGYVKEAHHRQAWPAGDHHHDSIGYAIPRHDWETGATTPVDWHDQGVVRGQDTADAEAGRPSRALVRPAG